MSADYVKFNLARENELLDKIDRLTRELAEAKARALPDGWVPVPVEPTAEIIEAMRSDDWPSLSARECRSIYRATLSARPESPPNGLSIKESGNE